MLLSNNTVETRVGKMSCNVEALLLVKIKSSLYVALQYDETTGVVQCFQLLAFVKFLNIGG